MTTNEETSNPQWVSNLLPRVGAISIDLLILAAIGVVLGLFFESELVSLGAWGQCSINTDF